MAFSRRKDAKESSKRTRLGRGASRDPFEHLSEERESAEEEEPWFLAPDLDASDLKVEAGISSNLQTDDLTALPPAPDEESEEAQPSETLPAELPGSADVSLDPTPPDPPPTDPEPTDPEPTVSGSLDEAPAVVPAPDEPPPGAITHVPMPDAAPSEPPPGASIFDAEPPPPLPPAPADEPVLPDEPYRPPTEEAAENFFESTDFDDEDEPAPVDEEQRRALTSVFSNVLANQASTANGEPRTPGPDASTDEALGFAGIDPSLSPGYYDPDELDRASESFDLDRLSEPGDLDEPSRPRTRVEPRRPRPRVTRPRRF